MTRQQQREAKELKKTTKQIEREQRKEAAKELKAWQQMIERMKLKGALIEE